MTDPTLESEEAREALQHGEKPDHGHTPDALHDALSGTDSGSDTRAGSLRGGSASGSDDDPDQVAINETLASEGMAGQADADPQSPTQADPDPVNNTGLSDQDPVEGRRDDEADAATG